MNIAAGPPLPDPFFYRLHKSTASIGFHEWGPELPIFDDVIEVLDNAEQALERELHSAAGDQPIAERRGWNFRTAHMVVGNKNGRDGMNHRALLEYLNALRESGMQYGFWTCKMDFWDRKYTETLRGYARLEWAEGPR